MKRLGADGEVVSFCYEAGPCGDEIYRQVSRLGQHCSVVAPSLIPSKPGDRVKTDRRDLTRAREDMKGLERAIKQRLNAFLLRYARIYASGRSCWTQAHFRWLEGLKFDITVQQIVFQECVEAVKQAEARVARLEKEMERTLEN